MNFGDEIARGLARGMGYRAARALPLWLVILIALGFLLWRL
jgi:hypothetical protein